MNQSKKRKAAYVNKKECVACGTCVEKCPLKIISIIKGLYAEIDTKKCVACKKCVKACPASVIEIREVKEGSV